MSRIYIGKLDNSVTEDRLRDAFSQFGDVVGVELRNGYAHMGFGQPDAADMAIGKMNGAEFDGCTLLVEHAKENKSKPQKRFDLRLLVEELDQRVSWQDLKDWAREAGDVTFTNVFNRDGKHFGVIEYKDDAGFENAFKILPSTPISGKLVSIIKDDNPHQGEYSRVKPRETHGHGRPMDGRPIDGRMDGGRPMDGRSMDGRRDERDRSFRDRADRPDHRERDRGYDDRHGRDSRDRGYERGPPPPMGYAPPGYYPPPPRMAFDPYGRPFPDDYRRGPPMGMPPMGYYERPRSRSRSRERGGGAGVGGAGPDRYYPPPAYPPVAYRGPGGPSGPGFEPPRRFEDRRSGDRFRDRGDRRP